MQSSAPRTRLTNFPPRSRTTIHGWPALLFSLPFVGFGTWIVLVAAGIAPISTGSMNAPPWVVGVAGGTFGGAGLFLMLHGIAGVIRKHRAASARKLRPTEPWLADHPWDATRSRSASLGRIVQHLAGLAFMAVFLAPFHWWAIAAGGGWFVGIIVGVFDLVMIGLLVYIVLQAVRQLRHGRAVFLFDTFPFRPGEPVTGRLRLAQITSLDRLEVTLRCVEEAYERRGAGDNQREVVVCYEIQRESLTLEGPFDAACLDGVPIVFDLAVDAPGTILLARPPRYWDLEVRGVVKGPDLVAHLLVPVYGHGEEREVRRAA